jgi:NAD(P)-dependent dehydrogenase (short-subunit alcohol dehydrogenase family)
MTSIEGSKDWPQRFAGQVALVTGAGSGLGRAFAQYIAAEGAGVVCLDIRGAEEVASDLRANGHEAISVTCDVRDETSVRDGVSKAAAWKAQIDVLANFAGVALFAHFTDITLDDWDRVVGINMTGTFLVTREAMPHLLNRPGSVVNISSTAGLQARPYMSPYSASKGGVIMLTKALAVEYAARGVRVNCVCPGGVDTAIGQDLHWPDDADMNLIPHSSPMGRRGEPSEIAAAVAYLASDDASFITGTVIAVDGASTA